MQIKELIKKNLIDKRNQLIISLRAEGYNYTQIATIFNMSHTTVLRIINKEK